MGNCNQINLKPGIESTYKHDFSEEAELEDEVPNLKNKKPSEVKKEVEKYMKDLKGSLSIGHFDREETVRISNDLLKYVRFTSEYEGENKEISKKIYSSMSKAGISELVKALWNVKNKKNLDLDDPKKHANFAEVTFISSIILFAIKIEFVSSLAQSLRLIYFDFLRFLCML